MFTVYVELVTNPAAKRHNIGEMKCQIAHKLQTNAGRSENLVIWIARFLNDVGNAFKKNGKNRRSTAPNASGNTASVTQNSTTPTAI